MTFESWLIYLFAVTGLAFAPGPNVLLALSHGAIYGRRKTLATISGGVSGFMIVIALSMIGIGSLMQTSAHILTVCKWLGGAYLIYLGIQLWRSQGIAIGKLDSSHQLSNAARFRQGFLSAIANPKVLLFFGAFLPQFINQGQPLLMQFLIMASTYAVMEFLVEFMVASAATRLRPWLEKSGRRFNQGCGSLFALLGASLPLTQ